MPDRTKFSSNEEYNAYFRDYYKKNLEKLKAYKREYNKKWRKENGYHNEATSKARYPDKERARKKLQRAVKDGYIKKKPCQLCGLLNSQGHHEDYSKPLEVIWLCPVHHRELHKHTGDSG